MTTKIERRLIELHIISAREKALRIFAFTSSVYPVEWQNIYVEQIVIDLQEFAFHARRVNQLCGFEKTKFEAADRLLVKISENDPGDWEDNYHHALNRLAHIKSFKFGNAHADHRVIFTGADNLIPTYVKVETDKYGSKTISLYGVVDCFLSGIIPEIKRKFPEFLF